MDLKEILGLHKKWLNDEKDGNQANLRNADLRNANLSYADLSYADLSSANLRSANLRSANLSYADFSSANLRNADLSNANLSYADLSYADFSSANLRNADLSYADLSSANLRSAYLSSADLRNADLSNAKGLYSFKDFFKNYKRTKKGIIVYKAIGNTIYNIPKHWEIKPNKYLEEIVNPLPTITCGCGVNFADLEWVKKHYSDSDIWECLIEWEDLPGVVVPYNTNGKARCSRLKLIKKIISKEE